MKIKKSFNVNLEYTDFANIFLDNLAEYLERALPGSGKKALKDLIEKDTPYDIVIHKEKDSFTMKISAEINLVPDLEEKTKKESGTITGTLKIEFNISQNPAMRTIAKWILKNENISYPKDLDSKIRNVKFTPGSVKNRTCSISFDLTVD